MRRRHGPGGWRRRGGRRPRRSPAGRDSSSRPPDRSANQFALAKRGENSRFAKAMRSEGDESGIAYWKRKERVIFKEEMFSMGAILMKLAVFLEENVSRLNSFFKNRHFLFENQSFLDFHIGNTTLITFGPHCLSETRVFTAFR